MGLVPLILLGWELRVCTMCTRHPDLVSLDFYATPYIYLSPLIFNHNSKSANHIGASVQQTSSLLCHIGSLDYSCTCIYMYVENARLHGLTVCSQTLYIVY